jgi:ribonuclease E
VRQLRLRDIGGIIVIDFIDMVLESNRDLVVRRLLECLGRDRTKHQVAEVTSLGLVQMTRKRVGAGLIEVFSEDCEHCNGRGIIVSPDPIDRPASNDGNGGNGGNGGGGDGGSGHGSRGRRVRGNGADTSVTVTQEPPAPTSGPTPAQIAAAAHAAAIAAKAERDSTESPVVAAPSSEAAASGEPAVGQLTHVLVEVAAPKKSRRRASRSAKSPAFSVHSAAEPLVVESEVERNSFQPQAPTAEPAGTPEPTQVAQVAHVSAPAARARRKRPRVVAPAGPPRAADQSEASSSEFGS